MLAPVPAGFYSGTFSENIEFLETSAPYVINGALTVSEGATLTVGPGVNVQIQTNKTLTVDGTANFAAGDTVTLDANPFNASTQVVVNGALNATATSIVHSGPYTASLTVNAGGLSVFDSPLFVLCSTIPLLSAARGHSENSLFRNCLGRRA